MRSSEAPATITIHLTLWGKDRKVQKKTESVKSRFWSVIFWLLQLILLFNYRGKKVHCAHRGDSVSPWTPKRKTPWRNFSSATSAILCCTLLLEMRLFWSINTALMMDSRLWIKDLVEEVDTEKSINVFCWTTCSYSAVKARKRCSHQWLLKDWSANTLLLTEILNEWLRNKCILKLFCHLPDTDHCIIHLA